MGMASYNAKFWGNDTAILPLYSITPEEIFRNDDEHRIFSVNFFSASEDDVVKSRYNLIFDQKEEQQVEMVENTIDEVDSEKLQNAYVDAINTTNL